MWWCWYWFVLFLVNGWGECDESYLSLFCGFGFWFVSVEKLLNGGYVCDCVEMGCDDCCGEFCVYCCYELII